MTKQEQPVHKHDCNSCVFLGNYVLTRETSTDTLDLYYCPNEPTVVARFGSDGPDYSSGLVFAREGQNGIPYLYEAKKLAIEKGFLTEEDQNGF